MGELTRIEDHARRALFSLNPEFWGKPRIASVVRVFAEEVQELEDAIWSVLWLRMVDNAYLHQLEFLGDIVGQPNQGYDTEVYRALVKTRSRVNRSAGRTKDLLEVLQVLFAGNDDTTLELWIGAPFTSTIEVENAGTVPLRATIEVMRAAKGATRSVHLMQAQALGLRASSESGLAAGYGTLGHSSNAALGTPSFSAGYARNL